MDHPRLFIDKHDFQRYITLISVEMKLHYADPKKLRQLHLTNLIRKV